MGILTKEQQYYFIRKYHSGDKSALRALIHANNGLVQTIAHKYYNIYRTRVNAVADFEDFMQEGYIGLIQSIQKFDISKDVEFSTYASIWITQKCKTFARNIQTSVRIPAYLFEQIIQKQCLKNIGVDCTISKNAETAENMLRISSLNIPVADTQDEIIDLVPDPKYIDPQDEVAQESEHDYLQHLINKYLNEREQIIVKQRVNWNNVLEKARTLQEIGDDLGITKEWVRQIENKAFAKLKKHIDR